MLYLKASCIPPADIKLCQSDGEGVKIDGEIDDYESNSDFYRLIEGVLAKDTSTKAGVKIILFKDLGETDIVSGVDDAENENLQIYAADGNIVIVSSVDTSAEIFDTMGRILKHSDIVSGSKTVVPVISGIYIVKVGEKVVKIAL